MKTKFITYRTGSNIPGGGSLPLLTPGLFLLLLGLVVIVAPQLVLAVLSAFLLFFGGLLLYLGYKFFRFKRMLDQEEKARTERLEMFDEFEEWHMLMQHYCLAFAAVDRTPPPAVATEGVDTDATAGEPKRDDMEARHEHEQAQQGPQRSWLEAVGDPITQA